MSCVVVAVVVVAPYDRWARQPLEQVGAFASHAEKVGVALLRAEQGTSEKRGRTVWADCGLRRVVSPARRGGVARVETLQLCETSQVHQADH